ncbi:MAG: FMN-binding negative transcriptional regulator [Paracoccus sp. (in: a-proteobacteria)]|uniref:FMN-binding negative transcriptional regulator n=1 Tax=Paracoccus sp. TaxID=267 RepID=UPI0026DF72D3|nr:FMN-binding negative transcriptional regulator [Paracoccus sp. (in: a-proteobacteria)]MDO5622590.1 FMN-binding negative transcriptional regulator [Paracoccus sp. (in: a-proteobacteria)]
MYNPKHFHETDPVQVAALMADHPLAVVVAQGDQGFQANHLPLFAAPDGALIGHVAIGNGLHELPDGRPVLAIFQGVQGYISPNSYPSKAKHHRAVPTWNYQVVHVHGQISFQHDMQAKRAAVALLTRLYERRVNGDAAWRMADAPADFLDQMLAGIVAFRITPERVEAKSKLSQNRDDRDLTGAVGDLFARGEDALAEAMRRRR